MGRPARIRALTLVWLHERAHEAGAEFAVVETADPAATAPVQIGFGLADLWLRQKKAVPVEATPEGKKK